MRIRGKGYLYLAALALALSSGLAAAQEPPPPAPHGAAGGPRDAVHAEEHEHANELAVFVGGTTVGDETHFTIGGEYQRRLGERWGLSFVGEHVSDIDSGVGWAFELKRLSLTPQVELDFAREDGRWETAVVFGVAVGFGF